MDVPSIYDDQVCDIDPAYADEDDVPLLAPSAGSSENKPSKEKKHGMTLPSTNNEWLLPGLCVATACLAIFIIIRLAQGSSGSQDGSVTKFIHVSKAGGSLLCSLARANNGTTTFGENCALDTLDRGFLTGEKHRLQRKEPIYYSVSPGELWWCPTLLKSKNAFSQEEIATLEEMELLARGELTTNLVIAVRDPVKRFLAWLDRFTTYHSGFDELDQKIVSKFVTVVGNPKLHTEEQVRKALDGDKALRPFVEADGCYNYRAQFYNFHMRHLLGSKVMDAKTPPDSTTLKRAQERLDKFDVVLDLERYEDSKLLLKTKPVKVQITLKVKLIYLHDKTTVAIVFSARVSHFHSYVLA